MTLLFKIISIFLLLSTRVIGLSCNRVFLIWRTIEINMILFLPLMALNKNFYFSNLLGIKYFFVQSVGSILFLAGVILGLIVSEKNTIELIIFLSLMWKRGLPPFHLWLFRLIENLEKVSFIILSTWQKILPFYIISSIPIGWLLMIVGFSIVISIIIRFFQSNIKKILIISSIFMGGWIISVMGFSKFYWLRILFLYSIIFICIVEVSFKLKTVKKFSILLKGNTLAERFVLFFISLAIAGFPPIVGFFLKIIILTSLLSQELYFLRIILIFSSIVIIYMYRTIFFFTLRLYNLSERLGIINKPGKIYILLPVFVYGFIPIILVF